MTNTFNRLDRKVLIDILKTSPLPPTVLPRINERLLISEKNWKIVQFLALLIIIVTECFSRSECLPKLIIKVIVVAENG